MDCQKRYLKFCKIFQFIFESGTTGSHACVTDSRKVINYFSLFMFITLKICDFRMTIKNHMISIFKKIEKVKECT